MLFVVVAISLYPRGVDSFIIPNRRALLQATLAEWYWFFPLIMISCTRPFVFFIYIRREEEKGRERERESGIKRDRKTERVTLKERGEERKMLGLE